MTTALQSIDGIENARSLTRAKASEYRDKRGQPDMNEFLKAPVWILTGRYSNQKDAEIGSVSGRTSVFSRIMQTFIQKLKLSRLQRQVMTERKILAELPETLLNDIGVDRGDASIEARRSRHELPPSRLRDAGLETDVTSSRVLRAPSFVHRLYDASGR